MLPKESKAADTFVHAESKGWEDTGDKGRQMIVEGNLEVAESERKIQEHAKKRAEIIQRYATQAGISPEEAERRLIAANKR